MADIGFELSFVERRSFFARRLCFSARLGGQSGGHGEEGDKGEEFTRHEFVFLFFENVFGGNLIGMDVQLCAFGMKPDAVAIGRRGDLREVVNVNATAFFFRRLELADVDVEMALASVAAIHGEGPVIAKQLLGLLRRDRPQGQPFRVRHFRERTGSAEFPTRERKPLMRLCSGTVLDEKSGFPGRLIIGKERQEAFFFCRPARCREVAAAIRHVGGRSEGSGRGGHQRQKYEGTHSRILYVPAGECLGAAASWRLSGG